MDIINNLTNNVDYTDTIKTFILLTSLSFIPMILVMTTSFTRIIITFSFLKSALSLQQSIPNQVIIGLSLVLTLFIMNPVLEEINTSSLKPYINKEINTEEFIKKSTEPLKNFMLKNTREKDLKLFIENSNLKNKEIKKEDIPITIVMPAFCISELKTAFQIGFLLYLPFLMIDLVVASILMSMGMFMLPPAMISLPFKLILFVMADGWNLIVKSLILGFS